MSLPDLPTNRRFLTHLFNSLASPPSPDPRTPALNEDYPSPLHSVPDAVKKQLLALQVLFPNEFVPALDVLDRQLVTRFRVQDEHEAHHEADDDDDVVMLGGGGGRPEEETYIYDDTPFNDNDYTRKTTASGTTTQYLSITDEEATTSTGTTSTDAIPHPHQPDSTSLNHHHHHHHNNNNNNNNDTTPTVYYVRSAQHHRSSRYTTTNPYDSTPNYQVRLSAWNCSCPAFTFAAFPACSSPRPSPDPTTTPSTNSFVPVDPFHIARNLDHHAREQTSRGNGDDDDAGTWSFGGISLGDNDDVPPVCKHLLACLLADKCSRLFGDKVQERWVSSHEAAAWAAGWAD